MCIYLEHSKCIIFLHKRGLVFDANCCIEAKSQIMFPPPPPPPKKKEKKKNTVKALNIETDRPEQNV